MSLSAINGSDIIADFSSALGFTRKIGATDASAQTPDSGGALEPGRYLVQLLNPSAAGDTCWVIAAPFKRGETIVVTQDAPSFPLQRNGIAQFQFNVLPAVNDRIAVRMDAGKTGTVYITRISRDA